VKFLHLPAALLATALWLVALTVPAQESAAPTPVVEAESSSAVESDPAAEAAADEPPVAEPAAELPTEITPTTKTVLPRVGDYRRAALHVDPIEAAIARGEWKAPDAGDEITDATGAQVAWEADEGPRGRELAGGYAYATFESPTKGVLLLEAPGAAAVCLNGQWVPGDPYGYGWFRVPVEVAKGENWLVTHLASPAAAPKLVRPAAPYAFVSEAATLPNIVVGRPEPLAVSVPFCNATTERLAGCRLRVRWDEGEPTITPLRAIDSLLLTPIVVTLPAPSGELEAGDDVTATIEVLSADADNEEDADDTPLATVELTLKVVSPVEARTDTFVSKIDGSVQPYGVLPAVSDPSDKAERGVVLTLHDAGESHTERLAKHKPAASADILAPFGRGRWGFDWEDWSREDALEALDDFVTRQKTRGVLIDESRVSVVGDGMGGHGALRLATLRPDRFAAVGITDGWLSFFTQGGARVTPSDASPIAQVLGRAASANDPLRIIENLAGMGVSLLQAGHADVSPSESQFLRERLGEFHDDFTYRHATGSDTTGSNAAKSDPRALLQEQVTWLTSRTRADFSGVDSINFATPNVGASATLGWATIVSPTVQSEIASVRLSHNVKRREVTGTTVNVRRLRLSLEAFSKKAAVTVRLDGGRPVRFQPGRNGVVLSLARDDEGVWRPTPDETALGGFFKNPDRAGAFKSVFCCRPQLVYGTRGSKDERDWMAAKARYDAHLFLYRGAGLLEVIADNDIRDTLRVGGDVSRSVVLYGASQTNSAWFHLQQEAIFHRSRTVRVERGAAWLGERPESGDDLSVLAIRPRPGSSTASVAVVGGTGITGMRMTTRLRYFWSGVEYPDFLLYGPTAIDSIADPGLDEPGEALDVRAAGYFDIDWGVDGGGIVWRDLAI
jgi:pimeloyl-ACP methyl ester carboxylesterase